MKLGFLIRTYHVLQTHLNRNRDLTDNFNKEYFQQSSLLISTPDLDYKSIEYSFPAKHNVFLSEKNTANV